MKANPKLSETSKLGCLSWSLEARTTCPGSIGADGALVPACAGCYAASGNYRFKPAKALRAHNREDWRADDWTDAMVAKLANQSHFRWFDSGDMYSVALARKMLEVMRRTPSVQHWLPTRMAKFRKFAPIIAAMRALPNVSVRFSSDSVLGEYSAEHGSTIVPSAADAPRDAFICRAYERDGKCGACRACWNRDVPLIAYVAHGRSMPKVIRIARAAH